MAFLGGLFNPAGSVKKWTMGGIGQATDQLNQGLAGLDPYQAGGEQAYGATLGALGFGSADQFNRGLEQFRSASGYQDQYDSGLNAIDRSATSRGGVYSGATMKAAQRFGQGMADQSYNQYLGQLGKLSGAGMSAAQQELAARQQLGQLIFGGYSGVGNAQAAQNTGYLTMGANLLGSVAKAAAGPAGGFGLPAPGAVF